MTAASRGSGILVRRLCGGSPGESLDNSDARRCCFSVEGVVLPVRLSRVKIQSISWTSSGGDAISAIRFLKVLLLELVSIMMFLLVDNLRFSALGRREKLGLAA